MAIFDSYVSHYQMVYQPYPDIVYEISIDCPYADHILTIYLPWYIPLNPIKTPFSYGFPMVNHIFTLVHVTWQHQL